MLGIERQEECTTREIDVFFRQPWREGIPGRGLRSRLPGMWSSLCASLKEGES
jgi:hypothetical protein